ncbi:MAG: DUF4838 domain-containing protein [Oscillospiraceae bacterium]|nr:DUF4838 domain-containing protein [Oscillospiraceae bacterium]
MKKIIAERDRREYSVVIPDNAHAVEKTAAEEVTEYLKKALSINLPTVSEKDASGKGIYIGHTEFAKDAGVIGKSKENWIIKMVGDNLVLTGGAEKGDRGIIYAVYHFLEDIVGVRWWNPWEEDVPKLSELTFDDGFVHEGTPFFEFRKPYMNPQSGMENFKHLARMRVNVVSPHDDNIPDGRFDEEIRKYGNVLQVGRPHQCHVMGKLFPVDEYFDEHPDWWAWNKALGKHLREGHRCLTNESFFYALCEKYSEIIEEDISLSEKTGVELPSYYSLSLDDLLEYCVCQCDRCQEIIQKSGYSGYVMQFVNRVARELGAKYPFARFVMSAYLETIEPPKDDTLPEKNVIINIADVYIDLARKVSSPTNKRYRREVESWAEVVKKAGCGYYVWDYLYNIVLNYPLPICNRIADTVKTWADNGIRGAFIETQNRFADFWELNNFLICHLLENPYLDAEALTEDFMNRYYGPAASSAKEYLALLARKLDENLVTAMCCDEDSPFNYIDLETIIKGQEILARAIVAAGEKGPYRFRIEWLRNSLDVALLLRFFDFKRNAFESGIEFNFTTTEIRNRIFDTYDKYLKSPQNNIPKGIEIRKEFLESLPDEEEAFTNPTELANENPEDVYQFPMRYMTKFSTNLFNAGYGASFVEDAEAETGKVLKISYDTATGFRAPYTLIPSSKNDDTPTPLFFEVDQEGKVACGNNLFREDIKLDGYNLYKIGTVADVMKFPDTRLRIPQEVTVNLRGLAAVFPMENCDVYLSMKFTGEIYGGKREDENAIYFDRMIVVRK